MLIARNVPHHARTFRYTETDLTRLRGRTVSVSGGPGSIGTRRIGRLSLRAHDGRIYFSVLDVCFIPDNVKSLRDSAVLPVVVLG